jgi:hypothetical protein
MPFSGMLRLKALVTSDIVFLRSVIRLIVTANVFPSSQILITLMMEAMRFSETSVVRRTTLRNIPANDILHSEDRFMTEAWHQQSYTMSNCSRAILMIFSRGH